MLAELCRWRRLGVFVVLSFFLTHLLVVEDAEARKRRGRGVRRGNAARVNARRGPRRGRGGQARRGRGRGRGRGLQNAPSLAGNNGNNVSDLVDLGPASQVPPDLFGGIGGFGNFGGFGRFGGLGGFGNGLVANPAVGNPFAGANPGIGDIRVIDGFPALATNGQGQFFQVDPTRMAQGLPAAQAVVQPLLSFNGKIVTGQNAGLGDVESQVRAFNQGEIPVSASRTTNVVSVRRR